jgi:hypothetical protein
MVKCENCGNEILEGQEVEIRGKKKSDPIVTICSNCAMSLEKVFQTETEDINLPGAVGFGVAAALITSFMWYAIVVFSGYELGIIAIGVGWVVAQAVILGSGRKRGPNLQILSILLIAVAMGLSEYLIVRHFIVQSLSEELTGEFPLLLPLADMLTIVFEGIKANPLTLLFWGIALWEGYTLPARHRLRRVKV